MNTHFSVADHVVVTRAVGLYTHHGIYIGEDQVVHYSAPTKNTRLATIHVASLEGFAAGGEARRVEYGSCDPPALVVARALSRLGERAYDLVGNNCEAFARWCKTGRSFSQQVVGYTASSTGLGATYAATQAGLTAVRSVGLSMNAYGAAQIMAGLARVGRAVGGGVPSGLVLLAAGPAAISALALNVALRDDQAAPATERRARRYARRASIGAAVAGAGGSVLAVSAAGTIKGLSAAGISSGLAAIGRAFGGRMFTGLAATVLAPALLSAGVGILMYYLLRGQSQSASVSPAGSPTGPGWNLQTFQARALT